MSILKKGDNGPKVELLQSILKKLEIFKRNQCTNSIRISEKHLKKYKENGYKHAFAHTSIQGYSKQSKIFRKSIDSDAA